MKAVTYSKYGGSDVLEVGTRAEPEAKEGDVVIKVAASGVNPVDWKLREGYIQAWPSEFPTVPGWDAAGAVVSAPADSGFAAGDAVYAYTRAAFDMADEHSSAKDEKVGVRDGTAAGVIAVPAWKVAKAPAKATAVEAAAVPLAALTAYQALHDHLQIQAGQRVLILAASGGVGGYAVSFAKVAGLTVVGTCSGRNVEYVKGRGADEVIDYTKGPLAAQVAEAAFVDVLFDCVGGETAEEALSVLKKGGKAVSIAHWTLGDVAAKQGKSASSFLVKPSGNQLTTIAALIDEGKVAIPAIQTFPLEDIVKAHDASQSARTRGKIVLTL